MMAARRLRAPTLGEDLHGSDENDMLDWTMTPKVEVVKDGKIKCFIATPQTTDTNTRQHQLHILREFELMPARPSNPKPPHAAPDHALEIRVCETDFRRCGNNAELLSRCALPPMTTDDGPKHGEEKHRSKHSLCYALRSKRRVASTGATERREHKQNSGGMRMPVDDCNPLRLPKKSSSSPGLAKQPFPKEFSCGEERRKPAAVDRRDGRSSASVSTKRGIAKSSFLPTLFDMCH